MERSSREGGPPMPLTIVFVERKNRCDEVAQALAAEGVPAAALHGGLSQVRQHNITCAAALMVACCTCDVLRSGSSSTCLGC
jgi:superfamily II helicase